MFTMYLMTCGIGLNTRTRPETGFTQFFNQQIYTPQYTRISLLILQVKFL